MTTEVRRHFAVQVEAHHRSLTALATALATRDARSAEEEVNAALQHLSAAVRRLSMTAVA